MIQVFFHRLLLFIILAVSFTLPLHVIAAEHPIKVIFQEADRAYAAGNFPKAIELYEQCIAINSNFAPAYNALGLAKKASRANLEEVAWYFKMAINNDPSYALAYDNLGKVYYELQDFQAAKENLLKALELKPDLIGARLSLAWVYLLGDEHPYQATEYFQQVLAKQEINNARFGIGLAYLLDGDDGKVLEVITQLRSAKQENTASQLENFMREGRDLGLKDRISYLKSKLGFAPKPENLEELPDQQENAEAAAIPVRLR